MKPRKAVESCFAGCETNKLPRLVFGEGALIIFSERLHKTGYYWLSLDVQFFFCFKMPWLACNVSHNGFKDWSPLMVAKLKFLPLTCAAAVAVFPLWPLHGFCLRIKLGLLAFSCLKRDAVTRTGASRSVASQGFSCPCSGPDSDDLRVS